MWFLLARTAKILVTGSWLYVGVLFFVVGHGFVQAPWGNLDPGIYHLLSILSLGIGALFFVPEEG